MSLVSPLRSQIFSYGSEWYEISDEYDNSLSGFTGNFFYYGYLNTTGAWVIQQYNITTGAYRYAQGSSLSSYQTAFAACVSGSPITFGYYNSLSGEGR
jgi:hypothetical protein